MKTGYLNSQITPYIGNKRKSADYIVSQSGSPSGKTFFDVFSGSGIVSRYAKEKGFRVVSNDYMPFLKWIGKAYIECNVDPGFSCFGGYEKAIGILNNLEPITGWVSENMCPAGGRKFYTQENGGMIDAIRSKIDEWYDDRLINIREKACLLSPLLYQASLRSNTSGLFKAFHSDWGGKNGKARVNHINGKVELIPVHFFDNKMDNIHLCMDSEEAAKKAGKVDVAYIDPPYNQHPYPSNYHMLDSIALWDKPTSVGKSAIRTDWKERRSNFNSKASALKSINSLLDSIQSDLYLISYSMHGFIPFDDLLDKCTSIGKTRILLRSKISYRSQKKDVKSHEKNTEVLISVDSKEKHSGDVNLPEWMQQ